MLRHALHYDQFYDECRLPCAGGLPPTCSSDGPCARMTKRDEKTRWNGSVPAGPEPDAQYACRHLPVCARVQSSISVTLIALTLVLALGSGLRPVPSLAAPLPPPRPDAIGKTESGKTESRTPDSSSASPAPRQPATQAAPANPQQPAASINNEPPLDPDHPPMLPQASRARMRDCGQQWVQMKRDGKDIDLTWRAFATDCLKK